MESTSLEPLSLYTPLGEDGRQFRLLRLIPHEEDDQTISCELAAFSLDTAICSEDIRHAISFFGVTQSQNYTWISHNLEGFGDGTTINVRGDEDAQQRFHDELLREAQGNPPFGFIALSYCWGSEKASQVIFINGHEFLVRSNVFDFLRAKKTGKSTDWFFIDAICINQADVLERQSQITLMGDIYRGAREVVAWLSDSSLLENDSEFFQPLRRLDIERARVEVASRDEHTLERVKRLHEACGVAAETLWYMCRVPYWSRLWVTQELLLGRSLVLQCGSARVGWRDILQALDTIFVVASTNPRYDGYDVRDFRQNFDKTMAGQFNAESDETNDELRVFHVWRLLKLKNPESGRETTATMDLRTAITTFSHHQCSQVHDKIFGLLGLTKSIMKVDYSMPISELYVRTLAECLLTIPYDPFSDGDKGFESRVSTCKLLEALLNALRLDLLDPVVILLTQQVFYRIGGPFNPRNARRTFRLLARIMWGTRALIALNKIDLNKSDLNKFDLNKFDLSLLDQVRYMTPHWSQYFCREASLLWHRLRRLPLALSQDGNNCQTYGEWVIAVATIVEEVKQSFAETERVANPVSP